MTATLTHDTITQSFREILSSLSEKERHVIEKRVGIDGAKETLQSIGNSFSPSITRERVRQIEDSGIKKIGRIIKATLLTEIQDKSRSLLEMHGGVLSKGKLVNLIIKDLSLDSTINNGVLEVIIQSDYDVKKSKQKLGCEIYFYLPSISKSTIDAVHHEAVKILKKKKDVMDKVSLYEMILENMSDQKLSLTFIDSVLDLFEDIVKGEETLIGLSRWKILNPKTLKDKAIYVMKKDKVPTHFVEIANKITSYLGEEVKVNTIHNELIRNEEFVLIGRGIYALQEWGFQAGTVLDIIKETLTKNGGPMNTEDIIKSVLKTRDVKETTIYMNLQNKKVIERVGRNFYQLKTA
ncbi:hypothetical protein MK079_00915 [Candidatus Gracilibacteria bacterium]|nr:hypothetical protein [Candidatus Gracilibacteria bacterium]